MNYILHYFKLKSDRSGFEPATLQFPESDKDYAVDSWRLEKNAVLVDDTGKIVRGRKADLSVLTEEAVKL